MKQSILIIKESLETDDPKNLVDAFFSTKNQTLPAMKSRFETASRLVFDQLEKQRKEIDYLNGKIQLMQRQLRSANQEIASYQLEANRRFQENLDYLPYDDADYDR